MVMGCDPNTSLYFTNVHLPEAGLACMTVTALQRTAAHLRSVAQMGGVLQREGIPARTAVLCRKTAPADLYFSGIS